MTRYQPDPEPTRWVKITDAPLPPKVKAGLKDEPQQAHLTVYDQPRSMNQRVLMQRNMEFQQELARRQEQEMQQRRRRAALRLVRRLIMGVLAVVLLLWAWAGAGIQVNSFYFWMFAGLLAIWFGSSLFRYWNSLQAARMDRVEPDSPVGQVKDWHGTAWYNDSGVVFPIGGSAAERNERDG